ncbi:MAG TPA: hypothetical protein VN661_01285 [Candidatus Acidoferrales bacterium]|nr:hypothetical protein [Candidatus Acidoferrales bacterium]
MAATPNSSPSGNEPGLSGFWRDACIAAWALLCTFVAVYLADFAVLGCRVAFRGRASIVSTVTVFYAARLKDSKLDIFYDQPQSQPCVRSIFPHLSSAPCWYARRHTTRVVD